MYVNKLKYYITSRNVLTFIYKKYSIIIPQRCNEKY